VPWWQELYLKVDSVIGRELLIVQMRQLGPLSPWSVLVRVFPLLSRLAPALQMISQKTED
jgi:hypothetical protein